jgi:hypothetical protein
LHKLSNTAEPGIYLGNADSGGILIYDPEKKITYPARTVKVVDGEFLDHSQAERYKIGRDQDERLLEVDEDVEWRPSQREQNSNQADRTTNLDTSIPEIARPSRTAALNAKSLIKINQLLNLAVTSEDQTEPQNFEEAWKSEMWKQSMQDEIRSLEENQTWTIVKTEDIPSDKKLIRCRFTRFKSRLVACGYSQQHGVDFQETFAPVGRKETLRLVLSWFSSKSGRHSRLMWTQPSSMENSMKKSTCTCRKVSTLALLLPAD